MEFGDQNQKETFPQLSICPGVNHTEGRVIHIATIDLVSCTFHDIIPIDPNDHSKGRKETTKDLTSQPFTRYINFQPLNCFDIQFDENAGIEATPGDSHSFISCRVKTSGHYIHVAPYGLTSASRPPNNWAYWTNVKTGQAINMGVVITEYSTSTGETEAYYEVEKVDQELRFAARSDASHTAFFTVSFVTLSKISFQQFYNVDIATVIGVIGGISIFFLYIYKGLTKIFAKAMVKPQAEQARLINSDSLSQRYG